MGIDASCRPFLVRGYRGQIDDWTSIDILTRQLDLCGVAPGTTVSVLVDPGTTESLGERAAMAARRLGADVVTVASPTVVDATTDIDSGQLANIVRAADLVIDLTPHGLDRHPGVLEQRDDLPRILVAGSLTTSRLHRLRPHRGLARRLERTIDRLRQGSVLQLSSSDGTQLSVDLDGALVTAHAGVVSEATPIVRWPDGRVELVPAARSVNGTIIAMPRDLYVDVRDYVRSPLTVSIRNDHVADITGSAGDADLVRALLGTSGSIDGYGVAAIQLGLSNEPLERLGDQPFAPPSDPAAVTRSAGIASISFGSNSHAGRPDGHRVTLALHRQSLSIDDRPIVVGGDLQGDLRPDVYEIAGGT